MTVSGGSPTRKHSLSGMSSMSSEMYIEPVVVWNPPKTVGPRWELVFGVMASCKRTDYIEWDEYFMAAAFLAAKRSKDPVTQVGACIVDARKVIVGLGYNGMPTGCPDDIFPWGKDSSQPLHNKYFYVCHAEMNAILNKNCSSVVGCTIYVALFPCNECAKFIIQSGIRQVVYMSDKHAHKDETIAAKRMFQAANIQCRQFIPSKKQITIDFEEINDSVLSQLPGSPLKKSKIVESDIDVDVEN